MSNKTGASQGTWPIVVASIVGWIVLVYTMVMSSSHIIETSFKIGLTGWAAYTSPILIDAVAVVGKLGRLERFTDATRRSSLRLLLFGGAMSLTANVYAGENLGQRIHGVLVVVVMLWIESHITKLKLKAAEPAMAVETKIEAAIPQVVEPAMAELESPDLPEAPVSPAIPTPRPPARARKSQAAKLADGDYSERHTRRLVRGK